MKIEDFNTAEKIILLDYIMKTYSTHREWTRRKVERLKTEISYELSTIAESIDDE